MRLPRSPLALALGAALLWTGPAPAEIVHKDARTAAEARGLEVVEDYGAVLWMRPRSETQDQAFHLNLGGQQFDPASASPASSAPYGPAPALRLVQFDAPPRVEWLQDLEANGLHILQAIEPHAYVVWGGSAALHDSARGNSRLRFHGDFLPSYKTANVADGIKRGEQEWQLLLVREAHVDAGTLLAAGAAQLERSSADPKFDVVRIRINDADVLERLAQHPGVYALHPVPRDGGHRGELQQQISANNLGGNGLPVPGYQAWLQGLGLSGAGTVMANVDGGIHDTHPDLVGRMLPCTGDTCGGSAVDQHGTHTAAIMAGDGASGVRDANGFLRGLGMAPGANLVEQVYSPHFQQAGGMLKLMRQSFDNGAQLSGNSWGPAASPRGYDGDTRQVDVGVRDVNPTLAGDQSLTYVLSIMNGNGGTSTQGSPDEAKNVITVGSTKAQLSSGAVDPAFNDLSSNSGHGPALDGRRIPHLVAPGCRVDSAASATGYGLLCGTSMASPQVAGAVALFIEHYRAQYDGRTPSAAMSKAALVASVQNLAGQRDANGTVMGPRPDSKQGWGRLRADHLLAPGVPVLHFDEFRTGAPTGDLPPTQIFDATGERWDVSLAAADPSKPVTLALVWTDAPGHGLGGSTPAWNNDLDLVVETGGNTYLGNVFNAQGVSVTGGTRESRNNIELVVLPGSVAAGGLDVGVIAASLTADALPNRVGATDQDFALVCVNCEMATGYGLSTSTSRLEICGPGNETLDIDLRAFGSYTGTAQLSLDAPTGVSGSFTPAVVTVPGTSELDLTIAGLSPGSHTLRVDATDGTLLRSRDIQLEYSAALPGSTNLVWPAHNQQNIGTLPQLSWTAASNAPRGYRLEVSTSASFSTHVVDEIVAGTVRELPVGLVPDTVHYWRVTPTNLCGEAPVSAVRSFRTATETCTVQGAGNLPLSIGPGGGVVTNATFAITGAGQVSRVEIPSVVGTHTYVGDLSGSLIAPNGTSVGFWSRVCGSADDFNFGVSDSATAAFSTIACPPTNGQLYRPAAPLSGLAGSPVAGTWTLRITDNANGDGGQLTAAQIRVCSVAGDVSNSEALFANGFED